MRIAIAQLDPTVGDLDDNARRIAETAEWAAKQAADLLVVPELAICGYPPKDLLLRRHFVTSCDRLLDWLADRVRNVALIVGHPTSRGVPTGRVANAASLLAGGNVRATVHKALLPNYDVFDEQRYFRPAECVRPVEWNGLRIGLHICEDAWFGEPQTFYHDTVVGRFDPVAELAGQGVDLFVNISASPFEIDKPRRRWDIARRHVGRHGRPFVIVNQVGGNDDLVFDGHSFVLNDPHEPPHVLPGFCEAAACFELLRETDRRQLLPLSTEPLPTAGAAEWIPDLNPLPLVRPLGRGGTAASIEPPADPGDARCAPPDRPFDDAARSSVSRDAFDKPREWLLLNALVLGLRDYMRKTGFRECVLGLSGGIDSSLAAYIAAQSCGPRRVHGLMMPGRYSSDHSLRDARQLADALGIDAAVVPIEQVHQAYEQLPVVGDELLSEPAGLAEQNLQARIRGALVMLRSNRNGWLPLATGNKSELAVGYCTLYGDMAGGFAVLCDLYKQDVYALARFINDEYERREVIPEHVLKKPPSAELAPNQVDQDTLPPYPLLDGILRELIEREAAPQDLFDRYPRDVVLEVARRLDRNEFKRRQLPPGIKLTARAFGSGRRMPIAARWDPEIGLA